MISMVNHSYAGVNRGGIRLLAVLALLVTTVWTGALPALAAPPDNDTIEGSQPIELPFWGEQDTSEATTDEVDAALNADCGAPATDASVWFQFTPEEDLGVDVFVGESDYSAGVIVAVDVEGELQFDTCGPVEVQFVAAAGITYHIMIFDDQEDGGGNGGNLVVHVEGAPVVPPPEVDLTIDPVGFFQKDGDAVVSGTFTCTGEAEFIDMFGQLQQRVGRFSINGFFGLFGEEEPPEENGEPVLTCDGTTQDWTATVDAENGLFRGGKATVEAEVFACGPFDCSESIVSETIKLRRAR